MTLFLTSLGTKQFFYVLLLLNIYNDNVKKMECTSFIRIKNESINKTLNKFIKIINYIKEKQRILKLKKKVLWTSRRAELS